jgi:Chaperone of endosialidase
MASLAAVVTLVLALTLGLALPVAAQPLSGPEYIPLMPCRVFDSRNSSPLPGGETTNVPIAGLCGVPPTAVAADLNFTIVNPQGIGHLTVFPANGPAPLASLVNYVPGQTVANVADIQLGTGGAVSAQPLTTTNLVVDVYGYFIDVEELPGVLNTALGAGALSSNTLGSQNTAMGGNALSSNTMGGVNTAVGAQAMQSNTTGGGNTAVGAHALESNTTGESNTAMGLNALQLSFTGSNNIAFGVNAGVNVMTGSNNIHIGNPGLSTDTAFIRIGNTNVQTATFIAGIFGQQVATDGVAVVVDSAGKLGTTVAPPPSSRRVKDDIRDMGVASLDLLKLRPVTFYYKPGHDDGARRLQYGLIAEEVAEIYPELAVLDKDGQPAGVRYHVLPAILLNELQRQQREIVELRAKVQEIDELRAQVRALIGGRAAARE